MTEKFTHLVLTRFNTAVGYAPSRKRLDSKWLESRLELFERYCFSSMAAQRGAIFRWVVFCDMQSPSWFRARMASFEPLVTPLYVDGSLTDERIASTIANAGLVSTPYLITTRLDNDDGLASHHLATVQNAFHGQDREFVEFPVGIQLFRGHLYTVYWPSNPFLSLIEKVEEGNRFTTVCCVRHDQVRTAGRVRSLIRPPQWLQLLHDDNLGNTLRGWPRIRSRSHPDFRVQWLGAEERDSFSRRMMFSAGAYGDRAKRWLIRRPSST
jgi:putative rhamnosyltransferase